MAVTSIYCECLNVCITENDDKKDSNVLGNEKVQELEFMTGIYGLRESSATCEFQLPSLIGKRDLQGAEVYRCHLCNSDFFATYHGHRMLTDLVRAQEKHPNNYSSLFRVNIPLPLVDQESQFTNADSLDYSESKDSWLDIVETEKRRLYDELQKKLYTYIKKEEEIYNEKCKKIDQQCEKLKCVHEDLLDSSEDIINGGDILRLARPIQRPSVLLPPERPRTTVVSESNDVSILSRLFSGSDSQFGVRNEQEMFLLDEDEISAFPSRDSTEYRTSFLQKGESSSIFLGDEIVDEEDEDYEREARNSKWEPKNMARSCAMTIIRPELGSSPRPGYRGPGDEKTDEAGEGRGQWTPPHTYIERLHSNVVPYSMPGRPVTRG